MRHFELTNSFLSRLLLENSPLTELEKYLKATEMTSETDKNRQEIKKYK